MKEYCIYRQIGSGCPFRLDTFKTLTEAKNHLFEIISDYDIKRKIYYIDNDFFENKYILGLPNQFYFQIQEREVSEWSEFHENYIQKKNTKIIHLNFYK